MLSILIVDDKEENLYYLRSLLEGNGYVIESARHGAEALVKARKDPPDVVISDLLMPVMDGYTLLRHWKADARLRRIPFIVYTATYTEEEDKRLALNLGADAFILKPAEPEDFIDRLREVQANIGAAMLTLPHQPTGDESTLLEYYSETLIRKLEEKTLQLEEANRALKLELAQRSSIEKELDFKNRILQTQQETSLDAIMVVGENGDVLAFNRRFIELWGLPPQIMNTHVDALVLPFAAGQTHDPDAFIAKVKYLYAHRNEKSRDELRLKDGRVIDRYSAPVVDEIGKYYGRIWYFRDVTESSLAQQALQTSELEYRQLAQQLESERGRLIAAQRVAKVGSWETDLATLEAIWSDETYRIFETNPASFHPSHQNFIELVHPDDRASVNQQFFRSQGQLAACAIQHRILLQDGRIKYVEENWQTFFDEQGKPIRALGTCQDISERMESEARIRYLNRVYAVLSGINTLIVHASDREELFKGACRIAVEAGGFRMAMLCTVDNRTAKIVPRASEGKSEELMNAIKNILSSSEKAEKTMLARAIRERRPVVSNDSQDDPQVVFGRKYAESGVNSMAVMPLINSDAVVGVLSLYASEVEFFHQEEVKLLSELTDDIAFAIDHIDKQERLNYLAYYDVLTGLANRNLFLERIEQLIRAADSEEHRFAIGLIDLERFKNINDSLGRQAGDELLKQVAQWLMHFSHDASLFARIDADHFAFLVPEVRAGGNLTGLFDKVSQSFMAHSFKVDNTELRLSAKTGIALFPDDGADAEAVFRNAEAALKTAKKNGDRYLFHTKKMTEAVAARLTMEYQLRQAIDNEEFMLYYQPKVNLVSGKITSAEALIRWNDPRTGIVPPDQFIPMLEETGLIYEVGRWALKKAIQDYLRWRDEGLAAVRIAVNVSPLQLRNRNFIAEIEQKISIDAHAAWGLELEITESLIMADIEHSIASLKAIRAMGITVAIDDFGTGFSSLSYLAKLPVNTLKIDRSFVTDMTVGPEGLALVSTIISLAHSLNLKVVAEGVETEEQSRLLRLLNCDEIQGYVFSKPVPVETFEHLLSSMGND